MLKSLRFVLMLTVSVGALSFLAACHTTAGLGQDVSQGGHALSNAANKNTPANPSP
jgi:predicted small secreted protein